MRKKSPYLRMSSFSNMAVRGAAMFTFIIIRVNYYLYTMCCHYCLFVGVLLSFRKSVILCSTGCITE